MKTIFKYVIEPAAITELVLPKGAQFIEANHQFGELTLWFIVDAGRDTEKERRGFAGIGTGQLMQDTGFEYLATVHMAPYVWHVFELV